MIGSANNAMLVMHSTDKKMTSQVGERTQRIQKEREIYAIHGVLEHQCQIYSVLRYRRYEAKRRRDKRRRWANNKSVNFVTPFSGTACSGRCKGEVVKMSFHDWTVTSSAQTTRPCQTRIRRFPVRDECETNLHLWQWSSFRNCPMIQCTRVYSSNNGINKIFGI